MDKPIKRFGVDVIAWAYSNDEWPIVDQQDLEIILSDYLDDDLLLRLASDLQCPKQFFFLSCLYICVGDYVRVLSAGVALPPPIDELLKEAETCEIPAIQTWLHRSKYLISHPETFDYTFWCRSYDSGFGAFN